MRNLERAITEVLRKCAKVIAAGDAQTMTVAAKTSSLCWGPPRKAILPQPEMQWAWPTALLGQVWAVRYFPD